MRPWARSASGKNYRFLGVMHLCVTFEGKKYQLEIMLRQGARLGRYSSLSGAIETIHFSKPSRSAALLHAEFLASEWFRKNVGDLCAT